MNWRTLFRCGLLLFSVTLGAAEKIALAAYGAKAGSLSDLFLAEFGERYEFVDRDQLPALEREQLLLRFGAEQHSRRLRLTGASLFAVLREMPGGDVHATLFETNCGLRLKTATLSGNDPAQLNALLGKALAILHSPQSVRYVSLAAIRNNLHYSLQPQAERTTEALTELTAGLDVVFLERDYMIELLRERELAGEWANALFASEILHFELNPGKSPERFTIAAYLTDVRESVLFRCQIEDPRHLSRLFAALEAHWRHTPRRPGGNAVEEAARFFREAEAARAQGNSEAAVRLSFAAFALDNSNVRYLSEIADNGRQNISATIPYYRAALEYLVKHPELLNRFDLHNTAMLLCRIIRQRQNKLSPAERQKFREFLASHRDRFQDAEFPIRHPRGRLERELNRFPKIVPELYSSAAECRTALLLSWNRLLTAVQEGRSQQMRETCWNQLLRERIYEMTETLFRLQCLLPRRELPEWTRSTCRKLEAIPALRPLSLLLAANALLYSAECTDEKVLALYREYFLLSRELHAGLPGQCAYYDPQKLVQYPGLEKAIRELRMQIAPPRRAPNPFPAPPPRPAPPQTTRNQLASCTSPDGKLLYYLTFDDFDYKVMRCNRSGIPEETAAFPRGYQDATHAFWRMGSDGTRLAVTDSLHLYTGTGGILVESGKFPFLIQAVAVCGGRVFLAGERELMSCNMAGRERRIHLSAGQTGKTLPLSTPRPGLKIRALKADEKSDALLILMEDGRSQEHFRLEMKSGRITHLSPPPSPDENGKSLRQRLRRP